MTEVRGRPVPERRPCAGPPLTPDVAQLFSPVLHERNFARDVEAVYKGDKDAYRLFVVRMVIAISLQKLDATYAGLADSYYLAAMTSFEEVIRPKDLKTLQCLILIGEYSLLTPTRTATYHIVGLAVRICQQLGLGEEKTIGIGIADPQVLDMRRRLGWIVTSTELNLSCVMGRPNGFAKGDDCMNVDFFATVSDDLITEEGIRPGPPCEKKLVAIHLWKMRIHQAEIRRTLYESKPDRPQPQHDSDPWFAQMEQKLDDWRDSAPTRPEWCKNWSAKQHNE